MAFVHGKNTYISLNAVNLSSYCNTSTLTRTADSHDVTAYGLDDHAYQGGLKDGTASIGGIYDNTAAVGPAAVIKPLIGTVVPLIRRPDGTGAGKAQQSLSVLVTNYVETSPVADMVTWTADFQKTGPINDTAQ